MEAGVLGGGLASTPHAVAVTQRETCLSSEPLVPDSPGGGVVLLLSVLQRDRTRPMCREDWHTRS